jgi:amino acid transporter
MCVALALLNVRGIDWVGSSVAVLSVVVTVPLVIFCLLGLFHLQVALRLYHPNLRARTSASGREGGRGREGGGESGGGGGSSQDYKR